MNKEVWDLSSSRLGCNETHGYHCVPNKFLTSLVEFCYPRGKNIMFGQGNCLELADTGFLNHVPCNETFSSGCPNSFYFGNELYKYPKCLAINTTLRCFQSDKECIKLREMEIGTVERKDTIEESESLTKTPLETHWVIVISILSVLLAVVPLGLFIYKRRKQPPCIPNKNFEFSRQPNNTNWQLMTKSDYYIPRIGLSKVNNHINGRHIFLSDEESNRVRHECESSISDPTSFSSPSTDERDTMYGYVCESHDDSSQSDQQNNQGYKYQNLSIVSKRMPQRRKNTQEPFVISNFKSSSIKCNDQQHPSADDIAASILAQIHDSLKDEDATSTTLSLVIDFAKVVLKKYGSESKNGSTLPNKDDTGYSESGHAISNSQMQGNANDVSACPSIEISRSNSQLLEHDEPRSVVLHNEKGKHEVVIRKEESKEPKKKVSSEQASRITSSHSKGKRTDEEEDSLSLATKKPWRKHRMAEEELRRQRDIEEEETQKMAVRISRNQEDDVIGLARETKKLRKELQQLKKEIQELQGFEFRPKYVKSERVEMKHKDKKEIEHLRNRNWAVDTMDNRNDESFDDRRDRDGFRKGKRGTNRFVREIYKSDDLDAMRDRKHKRLDRRDERYRDRSERGRQGYNDTWMGSSSSLQDTYC